jgi:hypothetical protein
MNLAMNTSLIIIPVFLFSILFSFVVDAHHGWSWYNGKALEVKGIVMEKYFRNPHDYIKVYDDAAGKTILILFGPPARNRTAGLTKDSFQVGDEVTVYGHQHADPNKLEMKTERLQIGDKIYNLYPERQ